MTVADQDLYTDAVRKDQWLQNVARFCGGCNYYLTSIRCPFDGHSIACLSKVVKVTVT